MVGEATGAGKVAALILAIASVLDLTLSLPERARDHGRLYERFSDLAVRSSHVDPIDIDPATVRALRAERLIIEADEPVAINALNILCHNEEAEARGYGDNLRYRIGRFQRIVSSSGRLLGLRLFR